MLTKRTTLKLDQEIYKLAKKKAIDEEVDFQELINEALALYLKTEKKTRETRKERFDFGRFDLGGLKGKINRKSLYAKRLRFA